VKSYTRTFLRAGQRWTCTVELTAADAFMSWVPSYPPMSVPIWREYRRWRDRCLRDYERRAGIRHEITFDIPQAGIRFRTTRPVTREGACAHYAAIYGELASERNCKESAPGVRESMARDYAARVLEAAPDGTPQ
jgi:hypothetical protein